MVLKFDHSEAQQNQPPEARQVAPERARPSEEDRAQEERRSIAENLLQRERRKASHSTTPPTLSAQTCLLDGGRLRSQGGRSQAE